MGQLALKKLLWFSFLKATKTLPKCYPNNTHIFLSFFPFSVCKIDQYWRIIEKNYWGHRLPYLKSSTLLSRFMNSTYFPTNVKYPWRYGGAFASPSSPLHSKQNHELKLSIDHMHIPFIIYWPTSNKTI